MALKKSIFLFTFFFLCLQAFSQQKRIVSQYTLENGLEVYLLEDSSDALVHINFNCKAGFSYHNQDDAGFFTLYSRLINAIFSQGEFSEVSCNADFTSYKIETAYSQTENILESLSRVFFSPQISDELLSTELTKFQNEISANAREMSTFINASIDSKVFASAPWKNDSGIYPPLFKRTTEQEARNKIKYISENFYTPQNSAIFIYGNINSQKLLTILKYTFGRYYSTASLPKNQTSALVNSQRRYVLHDSEISPDLTQVVIQYTMLSMEECDLLADVLNNDYSTFKQELLKSSELNIPGSEYINVASVSKGGSSRLIIQALIQKPEKIKISSKDQAELFLELAQKSIEKTNDTEIQFAKQSMNENVSRIFSNKKSLIKNLSEFWAVKQYHSFENAESWELEELFKKELEKAIEKNWTSVINNLTLENPFIFVIINSKDFKANKKNYENGKFEELNQTNSSWYVQEMYKEIKNQFANEKNSQIISNFSSNDDNNFYERNIKQISERKLSNGIEVFSKKNEDFSNCVMCLIISGGKLSSAKDNGLEEVMINILSSIIQRKFFQDWNEGLFTQIPEVSSKTELTQSSLTITFASQDQFYICESLYSAIIYGDLLPSMADRAVSQRQYKKRLENGSAVNQIFSAAIKEIYGSGDYYNVFEAKKDVLTKTDYTKILEQYPSFINAERYKIILTGNFSPSIFNSLEKTFACIPLSTSKQKQTEVAKEKYAYKMPDKKSFKVKIEHTFLTDIPKEEAGPMPAVLIPTTEFLDPVIYIQALPDTSEKEIALFNAMSLYITNELNSKIKNNKRLMNVSVNFELAEKALPFTRFIFQNVPHTKEIDSIYAQTLTKIRDDLETPSECSRTIRKIKDLWSLKKMKDCATAEGCAKLMEESLYRGNSAENYLEEYQFIQTASEKEFLEILQYFPSIPNIRLYSSDSKK